MPRKPQQERSRATVQAILQAAARVLTQAGLDGATTNHIARVAGVSIGSLYQYFPNKEALVRRLLESHLLDAASRRPASLDDPSLSLRERLRIATAWHLEVHASDPALHEMLTRIAPRVVGDEAIERFQRDHHSAVRRALEPYAEDLRPDLDMAAFIVAECMESLTHGATIHHPELLDRAEFADEIAELLTGYLERPAESG